jgi:hypothetical protein
MAGEGQGAQVHHAAEWQPAHPPVAEYHRWLASREEAA